RALLAIDRGDYANGTVQLSEALDLAERFWGDDHPEVAMIQGQLAEQAEHDDPERSVALFTRAIDMLRRVYSGPHPDLASTINNYAVFNLDRGRFEDARTGFEEALDMQRQVYDQPGTLEAIILNNLGRYHAARGDNAEALRLWRRSFELHRQIFGDTHEETSNMRINLGVALRLNGELDRAETLLNEALENIRAVFGENHRRVAAIYNNLGKVAQDRGDLEQATAHYERAVEIFRAIELPTADLANTLQNLATLADRRGDAAAAESLYLEALDALTMAGRDEGPEAARLYNNLSVTKFLSKDFDQAAEWSRRALAIFERIQEPGSADRLRTRRILARALEEQSLYAEAAPLMRENIEACKTAWGDDAEACARHVVTLDRLYEKWPEGASASR
ncbi:MAG: tetratricopeptide repeat protein, partial [Acidobacteriota bacterium]